VLPQDFVVDEQDGIGAPVGMTGARLEVNVHIVTGSQSSTQNIVACVNRAGVTVAETLVEQLAASESVLTETRRSWRRAGRHRRRHHRHRHLRARQPLAHGGDRRRRRSLHQRHRRRPATPVPTRKRSSASAAARCRDGRRRRDDGGGQRRRRKPRVMARRILSEILQPRAEEIFHLVWDEIRAPATKRA
jgi:Actin-like ATPase involved in cell division